MSLTAYLSAVTLILSVVILILVNNRRSGMVTIDKGHAREPIKYANMAGMAKYCRFTGTVNGKPVHGERAIRINSSCDDQNVAPFEVYWTLWLNANDRVSYHPHVIPRAYANAVACAAFAISGYALYAQLSEKMRKRRTL